jgi:hypothetical protein
MGVGSMLAKTWGLPRTGSPFPGWSAPYFTSTSTEQPSVWSSIELAESPIVPEQTEPGCMVGGQAFTIRAHGDVTLRLVGQQPSSVDTVKKP